MISTYDVHLVILSVAIAIVAAYTALDLAFEVTTAKGVARIAWIAGGGVSMGIGIWSMHFIGMLAFELPVPIGYDPFTAIASILPAIFASGFSLFIVSRQMGMFELPCGSIVMGLGIAAMHYTGIAAMRLEAEAHYNLFVVVVSIVIAIAASFVALWLAFYLRDKTTKIAQLQKIGGALLMGIAIPIVHYTGMMAVSYTPTQSTSSYSIDTAWLSTVISIVTFTILGAALLVSLETKASDRTAILEQEIADRKLAQQLLQLVLDNIPQSIFWKDRNSIYLGCNRNFARAAGIELLENIIGLTDYDLPWTREESDWFRSCDRRVMDNDTPEIGIIEPILQADGRRRRLETNKIPLHDTRANVIGVLGTFEDITERQEIENTLRIQAIAIDAASDCIAILRDNKYLYLNQMHAQIFGYSSANELIGQSWHVIYYPEEIKRLEQEAFPILAQQGYWRGEATAKRKDGNTFFQELSLTLTNDGNLICVARDITERKKAETALQQLNKNLENMVQERTAELSRVVKQLEEEISDRRQNEAKFLTVFDRSIDGIILLDGEQIIDCNDASLNLVGCTSKDQLIGLTPIHISAEIQPDGRFSAEKAKELIETAYAQGSVQFEWMTRRFNGEEFTTEVMLTTIPLEGKQVIYTIWRDISDRTQAEAALKASEKRYRNLVETSQDLIWSVDAEGRFTFVNKACRYIYGYEPEEMIGRLFTDFEPPEQIEKDLEIFARILAGESVFQYESIQIAKDGRNLNLMFNAIVNRDDEGNVLGTAGTASNMTDRKQIEDALKASEQRYRHLVETSQDLIWSADEQGRFSFINQASRYIHGYEPEEMIGRPFTDFEPPEQIEKDLEVFQRILAGESFFEYECVQIAKDGRRLNLLFNAIVHRDDEGNVLGTTGTASNITERKAAEIAIRESEQRFRDVVEAAGEYIWEVDANGIYTFVTDKVKAVKGYSPSELLGHSPFEFMHPEDIESIGAIFEEVVAKKSSFKLQYRDITKEGEIVWEEVSGVPMLDENGKLLGFRGAGLSISDRIATQAQLQQQEQFLRSIYNGVDYAMFVVDVTADNEFYYAGWNAVSERFTGINSVDIVGKTPQAVLGDDVGGAFCRNYRRCLETGTAFTYEEYVEIENQEIWSLTTLNPLPDNAGKIYRIIGTTLDITARKQAEEKLRGSQAELLALFNAMQDVIIVLDSQGRYLKIAPTSTPLLYKPSEDLIGKTLHEVLPTDYADFFMGYIQQALNTKETVKLEYNLPIGDRSVWFDARVAFLEENTVVLVARDISDRKIAEEQLRETQTFLNTVVENIPTFVFVKEAEDLQFVLWNKAGEELTGFSVEEMKGKNDYDFFPAEQAKLYTTKDREALASGKLVDIPEEPIQTRYKGERFLHTKKIPIFDEAGKPQYLLGISEDITERKAAEEALRQSEAELRQKALDLETTLKELQHTQSQLIQTEKMSSLGQLVAGVAHEINNPVNFIYGNLSHANDYTQELLELMQLYQKHYSNPHPEIIQQMEEIDIDFLIEDLPKLMKSIKVGAERIQKIVLSLRTFSRMDESDKKAVDIHEGIDSTLMILQNRLKETNDRSEIQIIKEYGNLPQIECYAGQLNQVFMNLLANAIDALEEQLSKGREFNPAITISTQINPANVFITIADNGCGIPEHLQAKLFDPFFTTKPVGKGTGMGLSISYQIVTERHGGSLKCISAPGEGTQFLILIPIEQ